MRARGLDAFLDAEVQFQRPNHSQPQEVGLTPRSQVQINLHGVCVGLGLLQRLRGDDFLSRDKHEGNNRKSKHVNRQGQKWRHTKKSERGGPTRGRNRKWMSRDRESLRRVERTSHAYPFDLSLIKQANAWA